MTVLATRWFVPRPAAPSIRASYSEPRPVQGNTAPDDRRNKHDNPPLQERSKLKDQSMPATTATVGQQKPTVVLHVIAFRATQPGTRRAPVILTSTGERNGTD